MADNSNKSSGAGEFDIIEKYFAPLSLNHKAAIGLKDDIAYLQQSDLPNGIVVSTDTIVENIHFRGNDSIESIAKKIARVNKSDIIAKGCRPIAAFLNLTWPRSRPNAQIANFAKSLAQELENIPLLGGDTTNSAIGLIITLTLLGEPINKAPILRSGAKEGDLLFVTGSIGNAMLGLMALESGKTSGFEDCINHYLSPDIPFQKTAEIIAKYATASLDVSDGLLGDAKKLAVASNVGIEIDLDNVPLSIEAQNYLVNSGDKSAQILALCSFGDDYQTLFCANPRHKQEVFAIAKENGIKISEIGRCTQNLVLNVLENNSPIKLNDNLSYTHNFD